MKKIFTGTISSDVTNRITSFIEENIPPYNGATHSIVVEIVLNTD